MADNTSAYRKEAARVAFEGASKPCSTSEGAADTNLGQEDMMKRLLLLPILLVALLAAGACLVEPTPTPTPEPAPDYIAGMAPLAQQYNSARDVVDKAAAADANPPATLEEAVQAAKKWSSSLEAAIEEMNEAYRAMGKLDTPKRFHEHQLATLSAWRAGIEASIIAKLYFDEVANMRVPNYTLIRDMNRLFAEEDRYQLEARRALEAAR